MSDLNITHIYLIENPSDIKAIVRTELSSLLFNAYIKKVLNDKGISIIYFDPTIYYKLDKETEKKGVLMHLFKNNFNDSV